MIENFVIISDFSYVEGGASNIAIATAQELSIKFPNKKIHYFCGKGPADTRLDRDNIQIYCTNQKELKEDKFIGLFQGLWNFKSAKALRTLLNSLDDRRTMIHLHTWTKVLSPSIFNEISTKNNLVMTLHDYFALCPNGAFYNYKSTKICQKKVGSLGCFFTNCDRNSYVEKIWRFLRNIIQKKYIHQINNFIVLSNLSEQVYKTDLKAKSYYKLTNPLMKTNKKRIEIEKNIKYAFIGRLDEEKGVLLLADAIKGSNCEIIFIGDGKLKNLIRKILPNAIITGWIDQNEIQYYLQDVKCLIFPSLWYETFGLTVIEAGSYGIPSIVSQESAASELISNYKTGLLFSSLDKKSLIEQINRFENESFESLQKLSIQTNQIYNSNLFSLENYVQKLNQIYEEIMK